MSELRERVKYWQEAGLVTADQAEAIRAHEALAERRRVSPREIFLYIGGLFVLMAGAFAPVIYSLVYYKQLEHRGQI